MTTPISVFALIAQQTADQFLEGLLFVARTVGLPVDTWRVGDPTRTIMRHDAETFASLDAVQAEFARGAFLDTATGPWLSLRGRDVYGITREEASFATSTVTITNAGGGFFELAPGGLIVSSSTSGASYQNQSTATIAPLSSVDVSVVAQAVGAGGTAAEDEIDSLVSPALEGVTITASTAALGTDEQSDADYRAECLSTLGALSPAGPADAYEYVAGQEALTGIAGVTRRLAVGDNATGTVALYVATATAALDGPSVAAIQAAVDEWAQPLCTDCTVVSATPQSVPLSVNLTPNNASAQTALETALVSYLATVEIAGTVAVSELYRMVHNALDGTGLVTATISTPAADVVLATGVFPVAGAVVIT